MTDRPTFPSLIESQDFGRVYFTLDEYRIKRGISKNQIVINANVQRTQLQNYCNNKVTRIDLPVLARICCYLGCDIGDIMRYEPPEKQLQ